MSTEYIIRAALHDETSEGWVWTWDQPSRTVVRITGPDGMRKIYCVARRIDPNFLNIYNQSPQEKERLEKEGKKHRLDLDLETKPPTVVMSQWYRDALGGFDTTTGEENRGPVKLKIEPYRGGVQSILGPLFAASQHPDVSVRLGTRLGVLGAWLGLIGISPIFLELLTDNACLKALLAIIIALPSACFGAWVCWPLSPPPLKQYDR
jgi:hypothetical protein